MNGPWWQPIVERAESEPDMPLEVLEQAISTADSQHDERAGYELRSALINSCQERGRPDLILTHFPWCLAFSHQLPPDERGDLLFRYRWAVSQAMDYPEIKRSRLEELIDDMADRYRREGYSPRGVWVLRVLMASHWCEPDLAAEAIREYPRCARDWLSDCLDTEASFAARAQLRFWPAEHAERICSLQISDPHHACQVKSALLLPLLKLGLEQLAEQQHQTSMRLSSRRRDEQAYVARGFSAVYLALSGRGEEAIELIERDLPTALHSIELSEVVDFLANAALVLGLAADRVLTMRLDESLRQQRGIPAGPLTAGIVASWCREQASNLCARYDQHSGNTFMSERFQKLLAMSPKD